MTPPEPGRRRRGGFTLLEVLAAVAILGVWYVVLAALAMQGLRAEGETHRRMRASLFADEVLADLEVGIVNGVAPPLGLQLEVQDEFTVRVEVAPFELSVPASDRDAGSPFASTSDSNDGPASLLGGDGSTLRSVHVEVSWFEGASERSVFRDTYAFDLVSARAALEEAGFQAGESLLADESVSLDEIAR